MDEILRPEVVEANEVERVEEVEVEGSIVAETTRPTHILQRLQQKEAQDDHLEAASVHV